MQFFQNSNWQHLIPQKLLSRLIGFLARCAIKPVKNFFIEQFIKHYQVDLTDALTPDISVFGCFNDFFTRALKPGCRPFAAEPNVIVSPADGTLSEFGTITNDQLLQAKGHYYSLSQLLAHNQKWVEAFQGGTYSTIYLAPKDYHRAHMPLAGTLIQMIHVPGKLFSVNQKTTQDLPDIFAQNERVICIFDTAFGPMAVILIGAMIVASIATTWHGQVTPTPCGIQNWVYQNPAVIQLEKAAEMGRFYLGSTVLVLLPKNVMTWDQTLLVGQTLKMGQTLGCLGS